MARGRNEREATRPRGIRTEPRTRPPSTEATRERVRREHEDAFDEELEDGARRRAPQLAPRRARAAVSQIPYGEIEHEPIVLPARVHNPDYFRPPIPEEMYVPSVH